jgi:hypothetical protein
MWEKLDQEIGRVIQHAERELHTPRQKHQWSAAIMQANSTKRYWKARWVCALNGKPTSTKQFLKSIKKYQGRRMQGHRGSSEKICYSNGATLDNAQTRRQVP